MSNVKCEIPWVKQWHDKANANGFVSPSELKELKALMAEKGVPQDRQVCNREMPSGVVNGSNTYYPKALQERPVTTVDHGALFRRAAREVVEQRTPIALTRPQLASLKKHSFHVQELRCGPGQSVHRLQGTLGGKVIDITVTYVHPDSRGCGDSKTIVTLRIDGREIPLKPEALATLRTFLSPAQATLSQDYPVLPPLVNASSVSGFGEPDARFDGVEDPKNPSPDSPWISKDEYERRLATQERSRAIQADWRQRAASLRYADSVATITAAREDVLKFLAQNPQVPGLPKAGDIPSVSQLSAAVFERRVADTLLNKPTVETLQSLQQLAQAVDIPATTWQPRVVTWAIAQSQDAFRSDHESNWKAGADYVHNIVALVGKAAVSKEVAGLVKTIQGKIDEYRRKISAGTPSVNDIYKAIYQPRIDVLTEMLAGIPRG